MKTKIFRIENAQGSGMYRGGGASLGNCPIYEQNERHPMPFDDSLLISKCGDNVQDSLWSENSIPAKIFSYGFGSIDQLRSWLYKDEWLTWMAENNFVLLEIDASVAHVGYSQAVYIKNINDVVIKHNIKEFFNLP